MQFLMKGFALNSSSNKDFGAGLIAAAVVFAAIKFGSKKPRATRGVTQEQIKQLKEEIAHIQQGLEDLKSHVFAILDEQTALTFAADVYGVGQSIRAWAETGDPTAAKGALSLVEALEYRFLLTLSEPPDFMSDETVVVLGRLYTRHTSFRLTIHALNGLENWSDIDSEKLVTSLPKIANSVTQAQKNIRASTYSFCLGNRDSEYEPPVGAGEPATSSFTQDYGLNLNNEACEILGTAKWSAYAVNARSLDLRLIAAEAKAMDQARKAVAAEIDRRARLEAIADLNEELAFFDGIVSDDTE